MFFSLFTRNPWWVHLIRGLIFIIAGLIIYIFPKILVAMISALLFIIGSFIIAKAFLLKKISSGEAPLKEEYIDYDIL